MYEKSEAAGSSGLRPERSSAAQEGDESPRMGAGEAQGLEPRREQAELVYYSQRDYAEVAYPSPALPGATVASGGCGVCCASMVLELLQAGKLPPPEMAAVALDCKARVTGGTDMGILGNALSVRYPVKWTLTTSMDKAISAIRYKGAVAVANVGKAGLFSDSGHYVVVAGAGSSFLPVLDPYLYPGKFDKPGRRGKVTLNGVTAYVSPEELDRDSKRYYIFEGLSRGE